MNPALPSSLINISTADLTKAFSEGFDFTSTQALRGYWKTYSASSHFDDDLVQLRSRNLFWRLLNSPQKAASITGFQLADLWQRCQTIQPLEHIWPLEKSDPSAKAQTLERSSWNDSGHVANGDDEGSVESNDQPMPANTSADNGRGGASFPQQFPYTRGSNDSVRRTSAPGGTNLAARSSLQRRNPNGKARVATPSTTARGKTRSNVPRRRSSQGKGQPHPTQLPPPSKSALKPPPDLQAIATIEPGPSQGKEKTARKIIPRAAETTFILPSSWQSIDENIEHPGTCANVATPETRGSLVDPDFRRTFAETKRSMSSGSNLATPERGRKTGSIVRFDETSGLVSRSRGKGSISITIAGDSTEPLPFRPRSNSEVISDDDDNDNDNDDDDDDDDDDYEAQEAITPRVESNLSKLIRSSAREPPPSTRRPQRSINTQTFSSRRKEEEILEMGRKAGAAVISKPRPGSEAPGQFRLPSPGTTF